MRLILPITALAAGVFAATAAQAQKPGPSNALPEFPICTGSPTGSYHNVIFREFRDQGRGGINFVEVLGTPGFEGSGDNLAKLQRGECAGAFVQADAVNVFRAKNPGLSLDYEVFAPVIYREALHLICNKRSQIGRITKLTGKNRVQIGPVSGGTSTTWDNLILADKGTYGSIQTGTLSGTTAARAVEEQSQDTACMLSVIAPGAQVIRDISAKGQNNGDLELVSDDDRDLLKIKDPKGKPVYVSLSIPARTYPGLQSSAVSVAAVATQFLVRSDWLEAHPGLGDVLDPVATRAVRNVRAAVGQSDIP